MNWEVFHPNSGGERTWGKVLGVSGFQAWLNGCPAVWPWGHTLTSVGHSCSPGAGLYGLGDTPSPLWAPAAPQGPSQGRDHAKPETGPGYSQVKSRCVCTCMSVNVHVHVHLCMCVLHVHDMSARVHVQLHVCVLRVHGYVCVYICVCAWACVCTSACVCTHVHVHLCASCAWHGVHVHVYLRVCARVCMAVGVPGSHVVGVGRPCGRAGLHSCTSVFSSPRDRVRGPGSPEQMCPPFAVSRHPPASMAPAAAH